MTPLVHEWVEKAEGDWHTMGREWRARKIPNYDSMCFHAQQCVEKYLKARLQSSGIDFEHTHKLVRLLDTVLPVEPTWVWMRDSLAVLSEYAVAFRYPGESADKDIARDARKMCAEIRKAVRTSLFLPEKH